MTDWILLVLSAVVPFLSAKLASSLFLEYSSCSFSLILASSASVTLAGSATVTFSVGVAISYFWVCPLSITRNAPGSVATELPTALFSIRAPSVSVAVA